MMLQSSLFTDTVQLKPTDTLLVLNSAADPFVAHTAQAAQRLSKGTLVLAEDSVATPTPVMPASIHVRRVAFHDYILHYPEPTVDVALLNLLYQPAKSWILYALQVAAQVLKPQGRLYVTGAKDRGILSTAKYMQELFGNVETLTISKGSRVICSQKSMAITPAMTLPDISTFAEGRLDEGTQLLLEAIEVRVTDTVLDIGSGAGAIGLAIAQRATKGHVTMVDASIAAVATATRAAQEQGLENVTVLVSDGTQAVQNKSFDLIVTNPPFHQGGIQTLATAERFIREASSLLRPRGRFYLVANRFLKYEPTLKACFQIVEEVSGDSRYKILRGM